MGKFPGQPREAYLILIYNYMKYPTIPDSPPLTSHRFISVLFTEKQIPRSTEGSNTLPFCSMVWFPFQLPGVGLGSRNEAGIHH